MSALSDKPSKPREARKKAGDCRCGCGRLLACATSEGLEIKCSRCRRIVVITWPEGVVFERPERVRTP